MQTVMRSKCGTFKCVCDRHQDSYLYSPHGANWALVFRLVHTVRACALFPGFVCPLTPRSYVGSKVIRITTCARRETRLRVRARAVLSDCFVCLSVSVTEKKLE